MQQDNTQTSNQPQRDQHSGAAVRQTSDPNAAADQQRARQNEGDGQGSSQQNVGFDDRTDNSRGNDAMTQQTSGQDASWRPTESAAGENPNPDREFNEQEGEKRANERSDY